MQAAGSGKPWHAALSVLHGEVCIFGVSWVLLTPSLQASSSHRQLEGSAPVGRQGYVEGFNVLPTKSGN